MLSWMPPVGSRDDSEALTLLDKNYAGLGEYDILSMVPIEFSSIKPCALSLTRFSVQHCNRTSGSRRGHFPDGVGKTLSAIQVRTDHLISNQRVRS